MAFEKAERLRVLPPYLFAEIDRRKKAAIAAGRPILNLGIGDPDKPGRVTRAELVAAADDLREQLQDVFDRAQIAAGTPNRPWSPDEPGINVRIEPWNETD